MIFYRVFAGPPSRIANRAIALDTSFDRFQSSLLLLSIWDQSAAAVQSDAIVVFIRTARSEGSFYFVATFYDPATI